MEAACEMERLPEECISHILLLTSPRDSCRSSLVSHAFFSAAGSDVVWTHFLPSNYEEILSQTVSPLIYSTKKELYFRLCDSILIDGGRKSFRLDKETGAKCYMLSARDLYIGGEDDRRWWSWVYVPGPRFGEAAELRRICWLEIRGKIDSRALSPNKNYKVYLIYKIAQESYGLDLVSPVQHVSVRFGNHVSECEVCLQPDAENGIWMEIINPGYHRRGRDLEPHMQVQHARTDGWMEIEMGGFLNDESEVGEVDMGLIEISGGHWKSGLIILGIEVRP